MTDDIRNDLLVQFSADTRSTDTAELVARYRATIVAVLDLAERLGTGVDGPNAVGQAFGEQIRHTIADVLIPDTTPAEKREPRRWPVGSPEPVEKGLRVEVPNGVTFRRSSWNDWEAVPPIGDGGRYRWTQINHGPDGMEVVEVLDEDGAR